MWDIIKHTNMYIGVPEERRQRVGKILEEIMAESFPSLMKNYTSKKHNTL